MTDPDKDISIEPGARHSGRARYAAAMSLYQRGELSSEALEVYRICSLLDDQDPAPLLAEVHRPVTYAAPLSGEDAIVALVSAADAYLSTLPGAGVSEVRAALNQWRSGPVKVRPRKNPVLDAHLGPALSQLSKTHGSLATAIFNAAPYLHWITYDGYPAEDIGTAFAGGHCYASIIGEDAAIPASDYDLGLFLIAPHVLYRDHFHAAPELYAPLTGPHGWRFGANRPLIIKPAHSPVWNEPNRHHLTKVGPTPFLALFGWTRDVQELAQVIPADDWAELEAMRIEA